MIKVLNLYAGIGGNRKLWNNADIEVTAVENDREIACIYQDFFPDDSIFVEDAHAFLLNHFSEYDFIWSSPPCPTHSQMRYNLGVLNGTVKPVYPDMRLYEEILLLQFNHKGKWAVENTIAYYEPLIRPQEVGGHYFWCNYMLGQERMPHRRIRGHIGDVIGVPELQKGRFNLDKYDIKDKRTILRNCVEPKLGLYIFEQAYREKQLALSTHLSDVVSCSPSPKK